MNASAPIAETLFGIANDVRDVQEAKAFSPKDTTLSGIMIALSAVQFAKASLPISVIPVGSDISESFLQ